MLLTADCTRQSVECNTALAAAQAPVLMRAEGLKKAFGGQIVLDGVDLELRQGEVVLLRGENGSGKTTLLNILTGNLEPDSGTIHYLADGTPRTYGFPRRWWQQLNPFDHFTPEFVAREGVGRTWQDIRLFGSQSLRDNIAMAAPGHPGENPALALIAPGLSARRETVLNRTADAMLGRLGLGGREDSSADKISIGQSKRVAIARAVAAGARILFLDEPLAGLDRQGTTDVLDLLESLVNDHRVTFVIVEHIFNQPHLHGLVTTDWLLVNGAIRRVDGNGRGSESACPVPGASSKSSIRRPPWFPLLTDEGAELVDEPLPCGALLTRIRPPGGFKRPPKPALEIRDLIVRRGARNIIGLDDQGESSGLNLTIYEGEIAILQAPNGWGKSTLFACLCGLIDITQGTILLNGRPYHSLRTWDRVRQGLRALRSDHHSFPSLRARDVFKLAMNMGATMDLEEFADRTCSSLSGGERQRLALNSTIAQAGSAKALLLDEPFGALDFAATKDAITRVLRFESPIKLILAPHEHVHNHELP